MKTRLAILILVTISSIFTIAGNAQSDQEDYTTVVNFFDSIANTDAYLGDTTKMQNSNRPSGPAGDIVTSQKELFTVYMILQGWPAVMCKPGDNPNVVGKCFVDEGVNLKDTLIYSAGIKNVSSGVSASFEIDEERISFDNVSRMVTLSLQTRVRWTKQYCCTKDGKSWTVGETSEDWLSQTRPAPQEFRYNKTQNVTYVNSPLMKLIDTPLTKEDFGFGMEGYLPSYSTSGLLKSILQKNTTPKNESVNVTLSYYKNYYRIAWDERRQIYYGELINVSSPPKIEVNRARLFYDYTNKTVSSLQIDNGTVLTNFWIISPFGRKNVTVLTVSEGENEHNIEIIVIISIMLVFTFGLYCLKKIIIGR